MKNCRILKFLFVCGSVFLLMFFCTCSKKQASESVIKYGIASVRIKVRDIPSDLFSTPISVTLYFRDPITSDSEYSANLNKDGIATFEIPVSCAGIGGISSRVYEGLICIIPDEKTELEVLYNERGSSVVAMKNNLGFHPEDMTKLNGILRNILLTKIEGVNYDSILQIKPEDYSSGVLHYMQHQVAKINKSNEVSESAKQFMIHGTKLFYLKQILEYEETMRIYYRNSQHALGKYVVDDKEFTPRKPDKSYYSFLKDFDLNNPQYISSGYYRIIIQTILNKSAFNIQPIKEQPIKDWLEEVKDEISGIMGFDSGLFYDILLAHAYIKQLNEEAKPLSEKQKVNIEEYYQNKSYTKILFAENENLTKAIEKNNKQTIDDTVISEKIMDAIISKHKGKPVLVDFWATWCGPCLQGISEMKSYKEEMKTKNMILVYITDSSSPRGLWEKKIKEIDGEHYYLSQNEWEQIAKQFDFDAIPTYLFYDSNGILKNKITGYPGNEKMRKMIEELLP